ncbi:hypothetical protein RB195_014892 [Necator americanus]
MDMENDLKKRQTRRMRLTLAPTTEATDQFTDHRFRAHLFDTTVLLAQQRHGKAATSKKLFATHRALERSVLKFDYRTQHLAGLNGFDLREVLLRLCALAEYLSEIKHKWAGHIMRESAIDGLRERLNGF